MIVVLAIGAVGGVAAYGSSAGSGTQHRIDRLVRRVVSKECRPSHKIAPVTFTDRAVSAEMQNTLGVLRRPQVADETLPASAFALPLRRIRRRSIRFVHAGGREYVIFVADQLDYRPANCPSQLRRRFARLVRHESPAFRRRAHVALERSIKRNFRPHEAAYLFLGRPGFGLLDMRALGLASVIRRGDGAYSSSGDAGPGLSLFTGLVPDPVATVTVRFPMRPFRPPGEKPFSYPSTVTLTASVVDNTVTFEVPRSPMDAFPSRQVWRDTAGRIVRVISDH